MYVFSSKRNLSSFWFKRGNIAHLKLSLCNAHNDKQKSAWKGGESIQYRERKRISIDYKKKKKINLQYTLKDANQAIKQIQLTFEIRINTKSYFLLATPFRVHLHLVHRLRQA